GGRPGGPAGRLPGPGRIRSGELLLQLNTQRTKGFLCDVIIVVQNALFRAHKNILAASSAYLKSLVVHDNLLNLDHEMVSPGIFRLILDFIYTGRLAECEPGSEQSLGAVLAAASYLQIPGLVALCKKKLKRSGKYSPLLAALRPRPLQEEPHRPLCPAPAHRPPDSPPGGEPGGHPHAPDPFRSTPPCAEPPLPRADGRELMYRWMKHEPLGPYLDEGEAEKDLEREEKAESPPAAPQPRYPSVESNDLEPDNSTSEETGSSEGPSPGDTLDRYCNHLGYEPESLGDNLYVCIPCGKGFPSSEQLNAHVEAHNEEELYHKAAAEQAVPFLDKGGPGLGDILRPYRCSSCDKSYKDPATLRQHEKTHWLTRPYPCTICGKKFTQRGTMTRHMRSHLGLKPFACDACGMRFTRQYRLTEHMRIHSGEKPYECQVCGGKFGLTPRHVRPLPCGLPGPPTHKL
uniref:Hypermethylated in cancer 1 protein n=1 Tax=Catharus ustulatus TaxID=91951 RepID=A0A8C3UEI5_CATUS